MNKLINRRLGSIFLERIHRVPNGELALYCNRYSSGSTCIASVGSEPARPPARIPYL